MLVSAGSEAGIAIGGLIFLAILALGLLVFIQRLRVMKKVLPPAVRSSLDGNSGFYNYNQRHSPTTHKRRKSYKMSDKLLDVTTGNLKLPPSLLTSPRKFAGGNKVAPLRAATGSSELEMQYSGSIASPGGVGLGESFPTSPEISRGQKASGPWIVSIKPEVSGDSQTGADRAVASPFSSWTPILPPSGAAPTSLWAPQQTHPGQQGQQQHIAPTADYSATPFSSWAPAPRLQKPPPPLGSVSALGARHATDAGYATTTGHGQSRVQPSGYSMFTTQGETSSAAMQQQRQRSVPGSLPFPSGLHANSNDNHNNTGNGGMPYSYQHSGAGPMAEQSLSSSDSAMWAAGERKFVTVPTSQASQPRWNGTHASTLNRDHSQEWDGQEDSMQRLPGGIEPELPPQELVDSLSRRQHSSLHNSMTCAGPYVRSSLGKVVLVTEPDATHSPE